MNTLRCAILDDYQHAALTAADWSVLSPDVEVRAVHHHLRSDEEIAATVGDCQILVIMRERTPFAAPLFERLRHLKLLVTTGPKNAAIDLEAAHACGVVVCGTSSRPEPPAELTWALILALARSIVQEAGALRAGGAWQSTTGTDLSGSTLGLLGFGRIGARVARVAQAFDMNVTAWSQNLTSDRTDAAGVRLASSRENLLESSDVVSIHLVLSDRTRGLVGEAELKRMKRSAYLINTSRAAIVDAAAMVQALQEGWIAGAAVDVFDEEPLPRDHALRSLPNLLATPHLGYVTRANYRTFYREAVEDIQAFLTGSPIRTLDITKQ
jgi:phosphoglycerate dehydrogenase-like enzyme